MATADFTANLPQVPEEINSSGDVFELISANLYDSLEPSWEDLATPLENAYKMFDSPVGVREVMGNLENGTHETSKEIVWAQLYAVLPHMRYLTRDHASYTIDNIVTGLMLGNFTATVKEKGSQVFIKDVRTGDNVIYLDFSTDTAIGREDNLTGSTIPRD